MSLEQDHANAYLTLLRTSGSPVLTVYDGVVPDPTPDARTDPYVLAYFPPLEFLPEASGNALDGLARSAVARCILHCVGGSAAGARILAARSRIALLNVRPTIATRTCALIRQEATVPPTRSEVAGTLVMDAIVTYRLRTDPA